MDYVFYSILGLLPSSIWLLFYLHKDQHPEPKPMVLKVFFWGALMGPAALLAQLLVRWLMAPSFNWQVFLAALAKTDYRYFLNIVLFAPLIEEYFKYAVVKWQVLKNPAFDEPLDTMLYLIISALGFAAVENLLNIFLVKDLSLTVAVSQSIARFLSATLLHTLSSGLFGFCLALALLNFKKRRWFLWGGFLLATAFHSLYNYLAWLTDFNKLFVLTIVLALLGAGALVTWQFYYLKKQLSICKIK